MHAHIHACTSAWTEEEKMALTLTIEVSVSSLYFSEEHTGSEKQYSISRATRQAQGTEETSATMWCKSHNPILEEDTGGNCT